MAAVLAELSVAGAHLSQQLAALADTVSQSVVAVHRPGSGFGAGVVWDRTGVIVTNQHVVSGPWAEVSLASGTRLPARVVASHVGLDLAVLKVDSGGSNELVPATIGDSSRLRSGELALAVGHPLGERNAVSLGVVSGLGVVGSRRGPREVIRLAISLRPGNSGGALSDAHGRVIGIPHMVVGHGLALAIPAHVVEAFLQFTHA